MGASSPAASVTVESGAGGVGAGTRRSSRAEEVSRNNVIVDVDVDAARAAATRSRTNVVYVYVRLVPPTLLRVRNRRGAGWGGWFGGSDPVKRVRGGGQVSG